MAKDSSMNDIYGNPKDCDPNYANSVASDALSQLSEDEGDVNGAQDSRAKSDMGFPNKG